jgi:DNA-binding protein YbaB
MTAEGAGREMAETLIQEATNNALLQAQQRVQEEARKMSEELGLPEIPGMDRMLGGA